MYSAPAFAWLLARQPARGQLNGLTGLLLAAPVLVLAAGVASADVRAEAAYKAAAARATISKSAEASRCSFRRTPRQALVDRAGVAAKVASICEAVGVDPALALSIAYQESQFNQNCVAPRTPWSGGERAEGVMQVLPATGKNMFRKAGLGRYDGKNEDHNIMAGCLYLKEGGDITNGSKYHIAGGYHAGYGSLVWRNNLAIPKRWPRTLNYARSVTGKWYPYYASALTLTKWRADTKARLLDTRMVDRLVDALALLVQVKMSFAPFYTRVEPSGDYRPQAESI